MITYWDLTEKERAELTREGVDRYVDAELMAKGCLRAEEMPYEPVPDLPPAQKTTFYEVKIGTTYHDTLVFDNIADAEALVALRPGLRNKRYMGGTYSEHKVSVVLPNGEGVITAFEALTEAEYQQHKAAYDRHGAAHKVNEERKSAYADALKAQDEVVSGLWEDWSDCRLKADEHTKVRDTFHKYATITDGDKGTARRFLEQAFSVEQIARTEEWFGEVFAQEQGENNGNA